MKLYELINNIPITQIKTKSSLSQTHLLMIQVAALLLVKHISENRKMIVFFI